MKKALLILLPLIFLTACSGSQSLGGDERTISQQVKDDNLAATAIDKVVSLSIYNRRNMHVNIVTNNGYLLLIGQVPEQAISDSIEFELTRLVGVKAVYNQLRIGKKIGAVRQTKDSWLTTKVKSQLQSNNKVNMLKVKVITENGEVFLIGKVNEQTADAATQVTREVSGVKQVVRVFEIIDK